MEDLKNILRKEKIKVQPSWIECSTNKKISNRHSGKYYVSNIIENSKQKILELEGDNYAFSFKNHKVHIPIKQRAKGWTTINSISNYLIEKEFNEYSNKWKMETGGYSTTKQIVGNENYKYIMSMGPKVLPLIFKNWMSDPVYGFEALKYITRVPQDPVPNNHYGNVKKMAKDWLDWAKQNNRIK